MNAQLLAKAAIEGFNGSVFGAHKPHSMCVACIDGRERGGGNFKYDDNAIRVTEIAAVIPPYEIAPHNTRAKFSFRKLKGVSTIKVVGHSFCGGAQTAIAHPRVDEAPDNEVADIVQSLADSGADLPRLRDAFIKACEGNTVYAANLLSRHLVLVSLDNISGYPHINEQIISRQLDVIPLYHMLKEGTGEPSHLERFDVARQRWIKIEQSLITNMCERPDNCESCSTCHATIEKSLSWVPVESVNDNGGVEMVDVPFHIARLIEERRSFYQPRLDVLKKTKTAEHPIRFYPTREMV